MLLPMSKQFLYILITLIGLLIIGGAVFFFFFRTSSTPNQPSNNGFFGFGSSVANTPDTTGDNTNVPQAGNSLSEKVFKIADGPIAGASFTQTSNPTTTLARYVRADNGHVLDLPLGVSGAVARAVREDSRIDATGLPGGIILSLHTASLGRA